MFQLFVRLCMRTVLWLFFYNFLDVFVLHNVLMIVVVIPYEEYELVSYPLAARLAYLTSSTTSYHITII